MKSADITVGEEYSWERGTWGARKAKVIHVGKTRVERRGTAPSGRPTYEDKGTDPFWRGAPAAWIVTETKPYSGESDPGYADATWQNYLDGKVVAQRVPVGQIKGLWVERSAELAEVERIRTAARREEQEREARRLARMNSAAVKLHELGVPVRMGGFGYKNSLVLDIEAAEGVISRLAKAQEAE